MRRLNWYDMLSYGGIDENGGCGFFKLFKDITLHKYNINNIKNWWL